MEYSNNPFLLADEDNDIEEQENTNQDEVVHDHVQYSTYDTQDNYPNSPKLINLNFKFSGLLISIYIQNARRARLT